MIIVSSNNYLPIKKASIITPILQIRKLRYKDLKQLVQSYPVAQE